MNSPIKEKNKPKIPYHTTTDTKETCVSIHNTYRATRVNEQLPNSNFSSSRKLLYFSMLQCTPFCAFSLRPAFIILHRVGATAPETRSWRFLRLALYFPFPTLVLPCGHSLSDPDFTSMGGSCCLLLRRDENWFFVVVTTTEPMRMAKSAVARFRSGPIDQWMARTCWNANHWSKIKKMDETKEKNG